VIVICEEDNNYNTIENCTLYDSGWNAIQLEANREPPDGTGIPSTYITVRNCTIYNNMQHAAIDLYGNFQHVTIEGNEFYNNPSGCIFTHDPPDYQEYVTIRDNYFHDTLSTGAELNAVSYCSMYNNTFENIPAHYPIYLAYDSHDYEIYNNSFYNCMSPRTVGGYNFVFDRNYIHADSGMYLFSYNSCGTCTVRNPLGKKSVSLYGGGNDSLELDDGTVFTTTPSEDYSSFTPVRYYPDRSNCSMGQESGSGDAVIQSVVTYPITLRPTTGHLYDVTVNVWDEDSDTYCITASSTVPDNPTWIDITTKSASATYDITRDGESPTKATTGADGVLRYHYTGAWGGPHTFKFSYASDGVDPAPRVTNLRNDAPTQQTITLRWDCSAPDMDHYTIYRDGVLPDTTVNKYYSATNLAPDTAYTFSVSATNKGGITGDSVSITVRTAAEESFDSNTLHIPDDVTASRGNSVTVPIVSHDATGVACDGVKLTYDASVVAVTSITQGDFTTYFGFDDESAAEGWVTVNTYVSETSLTGDVKIADVTLKAVGDAGDTSPLDMEIIAMTDQSGHPVSGTVRNGLFTVVSDSSPPVVTHPSASQLIPDDTDGVPSWGETATLNVTVTDESDIAGVTIDLSAIGGSPVQPMTYIGNDVWSVTTNASAGTPPRTYELLVCATDIHGYTNMQESVELVVMRNGDVTGDNDVTPDDVALLENYVTYPGRYAISSEFVADVTDDGAVNIADAMMLANYVASPDQRTLRYVGDTY